MEPALTAYLGAWLVVVAVATAVAVRHRGTIELFAPGYRALLLVRWRLAMFGVALAAIVLMAPYTGDPTWDWIDAGFMAGLSYLSAPWSVGVLVRSLLGRTSSDRAIPVPRWPSVLVAPVAWMFSASWSYDLYILVRHGTYPPAFLVNIAASSVLYVSVALLFSLDELEGRGVSFAFLDPGWPRRQPNARFRAVAPYTIPFVAIGGIGLGWFVWVELGLGG